VGGFLFGEDMTQEPDEVTQAQNQLDVEQGIESGASALPVTAEQVAEIVRTQLRPIESQIRGVQSINDKAADAIRRDVTAEMEQRFGSLQSEMGRAKYMDSLDEREREVIKPLLDELDRRSSTPQVNEPEPAVAQQSGSPDQWEQVYRLVDNFGLQRNDPRVKYDVLVDASLTPEQREAQFLGSLREALVQPAPTAQTTQVRTPQATANPPVETSSGAAAAGAMTSMDSLRDALLEGRVSRDEYKEQAQTKFGVTV
jgi:hypothetical protein